MSLAIESGATKTVAIYVGDNDGQQTPKRYHFGAANFKLLKPTQLESFLNEVKTTTSKHVVNRIAIGMPGIIADLDKKALVRAVNQVWPNLDSIWVGSDTDTALACIDDTKYDIKCIVISGTGSCCYGNNGQQTLKIGGYGHILGDRGSGYNISHMALREALKDYEYNTSNDTEPNEDKSSLMNAILKHLNLQSVYELVGWSVVSTKTEIADLAQLIVKRSVIENSIAKHVVNIAVEDLVNDIKCLITKLKNGHKVEDKKIQIGFTGSLLSKCEIFSKLVTQRLRQSYVDIDIMILKDTVMGALKMINSNIGSNYNNNNGLENGLSINQMTNEQLAQIVLPISTSLSLTETRNENSLRLDSMSVREAIELMISEESKNFDELRRHVDSIETLVNKITLSFKNNGRVFYVGAGTSGRLGVLDASECPPTFSVPSYMVQGIIAGGYKALLSPIEGAEDSIVDGINAIEDKSVTENDVVIGIAACGRTPFVWGSLYGALNRKAYTCLLSFNPNLKPKINLDLLITVSTGPEVLTGSTRLKAGTATKCILNMLTTLSMVQIGKCFENLMVDLMPSNDKLRDRAFRITSLLLNCEQLSNSLVKQCLEKNKYDIKKTVLELRQSIPSLSSKTSDK